METSQNNLTFSSISMFLSNRISNSINNNSNNNGSIILKQAQTTCPQCNLISKITEITKDKKDIIFKCKKKFHGKIRITIEEYLNRTMNYNINNYKCDICRKIIQKYFLKEKFKYCFECKKIIYNECI